MFILVILISLLGCNTKSESMNYLFTPKQTEKDLIIPKRIGKPRILFIGNNSEELYYSNTPSIFLDICKANNETMDFSINADYKKNKEETDQIFKNKDKDGNYFDYVVYYESTSVALSDLDKFKTNTKTITEKIRKNSPYALIYIYQAMSPVSVNDFYHKDYYKILQKNSTSVIESTKGLKLLKAGDAFMDAYFNPDNKYNYFYNNIDNLSKNPYEELNDGKFLQAVLLYTTIFNKKPIIPEIVSLRYSFDLNELIHFPIVRKEVTDIYKLIDIAYNNQ